MLGRLAADRERRVVLVLDEFQEVVAIDPTLIKLMRSVSQEQPEVAHIYLGSKRHMMRQIFNDENEPFWRSAKQMELDVIPPDLFATYACARSKRTDKELQHSLPATPTVQTALNALERGELIKRLSRGQYRISEPFLTEWIRRYES